MKRFTAKTVTTISRGHSSHRRMSFLLLSTSHNDQLFRPLGSLTPRSASPVPYRDLPERSFLVSWAVNPGASPHVLGMVP